MRHIIAVLMLTYGTLPNVLGSELGRDDAAQPAAALALGPHAQGSAPVCVTAADVKAALGFEVRELTKGMQRYGPIWSCGFAAVDDNALPGVTVKIMIEPGSEADARFKEMRQTVTTARGKPTEPDPIALGERGMAYRTASRTMAAAVKGGQLYSVDVAYGAVAKFGDKQQGTVALLRKLVGA